MASYASESDVRLAFQLNDTALVPSALIVASIAAAHDGLCERLEADVAAGAVPDAVVRGEALLAGACVLRSLAAQDAVLQRQLAIGTQRIETGSRHTALVAMAEMAEAQAWQTLSPYLAAWPGRVVGGSTDSVSVLGEV